MSQPFIAALFLYGAILLLVAAALWDAVTMTIPNYLVLAVLALYVASLVVNFVVSDILFDLLAAVIIFIVCFVLFALGWLGGGDAKLAPGAVLWVGYDGFLEFVVAMTLAGGALSIALLILRGGLRAASASQDRLPLVLQWASPIPYGIAISAGAILMIWLQNSASLLF
ncbi:MAG: peptidase [Alphaproteobacteria bacterium]|nr:peptidase [Alphaproteobacteria bacterium]